MERRQWTLTARTVGLRSSPASLSFAQAYWSAEAIRPAAPRQLPACGDLGCTGRAGDARAPPRLVKRNAAGSPLHVGHSALGFRRAGMEVVPTLTDGLYGDMDQLEALWDHAIRCRPPSLPPRARIFACGVALPTAAVAPRRDQGAAPPHHGTKPQEHRVAACQDERFSHRRRRHLNP